ncbi:hypothetical protein BGX38DRAFT_1271611 [Terfezia claveryi]|nr:hypothetical protein BGX38DRAFT_1271611 [Terfezia claveryi]
MAALMSSQPPCPVPVSQYTHSSGVSGGGGGGVTSPRSTASASAGQQAQNLHSVLRSPTSDQQQTRPPRTVRVQQPPSGSAHVEASSQGRPRTGGSGGGAPQHRPRHPPTSSQPQPQPTSHPHSGSRSGVNPTGSLNGIINNNVNNNSNTSSRPEPPHENHLKVVQPMQLREILAIQASPTLLKDGKCYHHVGKV